MSNSGRDGPGCRSGLDLIVTSLLCRWNDKKAKMHYILFCMPEISPSKLYLLRKGTDVNRYGRLAAGSRCTFIYLNKPFDVFPLFSPSTVPSSVVSIDLSHHLDGEEEENSAAQSVSSVSFQKKADDLSNVSEGNTVLSSRSNHVYRCLDARFYDDEMLTVVLQGSEEENRKRVLAQIPLASTLSCETEVSWEPNMM